MKLKHLFLTSCLALLIVSCSKDEATPTEAFDVSQIKTSSEIDGYTEDISAIIDNQIDVQTSVSGKSLVVPESILPPCATITTVITANSWIRTIDFGTQGCALPNGNVYKGKMIITKTTSTTPFTKTFAITFDSFYVNDKKIEGTKTIVRTLTTTAPIHPISTMTMNITVTYPNGFAYVRTGTRISEMVEGFTTAVWNDNIFKVTGNWTTTRPNWSQTSTITAPLFFRMNCQYRLVRGKIEVVRNTNLALIDYGDGTCDNLATITINGVTTPFTFGN
jgi:hypothetical protein